MHVCGVRRTLVVKLCVENTKININVDKNFIQNYVVNGPRVCHVTILRGEYNVNAFQGSCVMFLTVTDRGIVVEDS